MIYIDLKKAFDTVSRQILSQKLIKTKLPCNIIGTILQFLKYSRLTINNQNVYTGRGVPQSAVLSPTLFNVMINDLWECMPRAAKVYAFADDIVIIVEGENLLNRVIAAFENYCTKKLLTINK